MPTRERFIRCGALVLLLAGAGWLGRTQTPKRKSMAVEFRALPVANPSAATAVKLVGGNGVSLLYSSAAGPIGSSLSVAHLNGTSIRTESLGPLSSLPEQPSWDAAAEGKAFSVVTTRAGSAISALSIRNTGGGESSTVNRHSGFGVFGAPHFVKGEPGPISSVALDDGRTDIVLFPREADGGYGEFRTVQAEIEGVVQDARLVRAGKQYLLFAKIMSIGSSMSARREASGKVIHPGQIQYVPLDGELHATAPLSLPLGGHLVIDFDVCAWGDGVALFAVTPKGYVLATGKLVNGVFAVGTWSEQLHERPLGSPSIVGAGSKLYVAALESIRTPDARVLVGEIK